MQKHSALALAALMAATIVGFGCGGEDNPTRTPDESGTPPIEDGSEGEESPSPSCKEDVTCGDPIVADPPDPEVQPDPAEDPTPEENPPPDDQPVEPPKECEPHHTYHVGMELECDIGRCVLTRDEQTCDWHCGRPPEGNPIYFSTSNTTILDEDCNPIN